MVVDFEPDPRVPLILGRSFLKTSRALIDVYQGEITLRVGKEAITFNLDQTSRYTANYDHMTANRIEVIDMACEEYSQEVLGFSNETNSFLALEDDPTSPKVDYSFYDSERDILLLEEILNSDSSPPPPNQRNYLPETQKELKVCEAKTVKSSIDEPLEVELKDLPPHLEYAFLEGEDKLPVIIAKDLKDEEKAALIKVLKSHKQAIAWKLSDIKGVDLEFCTHKVLMEEDYKPTVQHQRWVNPKIHDVIKKEVEKLLDAGLIYPISDSPWVIPVHCVPKKGGITIVKNDDNDLIPTRLVTGWRVCIDYRKLNEATRKDHFPLPFMDQELERLAGNQYYCFFDGFLGYCQIPIDPKDQEKTTFTFPYETFAYRRMPFRLCNAPGTFFLYMPIPFGKNVKMDAKARLMRWILLLQEFDIDVQDKKGAKNVAADHFSRLENPHQDEFENKEITKTFPLKTLGLIALRSDSTPWFADFANYHAGNFIVKGISVLTKSLGVVFRAKKLLTFLKLATVDPPGDTTAQITPPKRSLMQVSFGLRFTKMPMTLSPDVTFLSVKAKFRSVMKCRKTPSKFAVCEIFDIWGIDFMGPFPSSRGNKYILVAFDYLSKWVKAKALPTNDARVVCKFLKSLFARFGAPRAIISDRGTHFCNDQFSKVMLKYEVTHRLSTVYHPQTSGQVEVSNRGLKRILERTVGENRTSWSDKLDDALWAFRTAYKTSIGCTPYKLVYGKACHLSLNELNEIRDHAYENSLIYKEKTKRIHDAKIKNRVFNVGDQVLLFNSRLKIFFGKLKSRWSGPFTIVQVFPYGTVELSQSSGLNFKVNGHRLKHYFRGDIPTEFCPSFTRAWPYKLGTFKETLAESTEGTPQFEWGRFVTAVKLNRGMRESNYDQLFAYLKQHEAHAKENKMVLERLSQPTADPLSLLSNVSNIQHGLPSLSTSSITPLTPPRANSTDD
nr:reverse transcriptase domain-containing protein [Tanacetum cinerariifolium]